MTEKSTDDIKKVFISYSWTTQEHEKWVLSLAERLMNDGIETILDKWDLEEGHDKYKFMEKMVQDESIDKVLIVCDKGYKEKANDRIGGVGTETQIITPELYNKSSQTKFIPIIAEKGETSFDEYMPHYLKSRIAIDMSNSTTYLKGYEQLIRHIYNKPLHRKPKLGKRPSFLDGDSKTTSKLHFINEQLGKYIQDNRMNMVNSIIKDFKDTFFDELNNFIILNEDFIEPHDEQIISNIDEMLILRDYYLEFIELLIIAYDKFDEDIIIDFFEELYTFTFYNGTDNFYYRDIIEHFKFLITELFLWTNLILFDNKKYNIMHGLIYTLYFVKSRYKNERITFPKFRFYLTSLENRNSRLNLMKTSLIAEKLLERTTYKNRNYKDLFIEIDILLCYISLSSDMFESTWFPYTYFYRNEDSSMSIIAKLERKKYFNDIKILFNLDTTDKMKSFIDFIENKLTVDKIRYPNSFSHVPLIRESININDIGKF